MIDRHKVYENKAKRKILSISFATKDEKEDYQWIIKTCKKLGFIRNTKKDGKKKITPIPSLLIKKIIRLSRNKNLMQPGISGKQVENIQQVIREIHKNGSNLNQALKLAHTLKKKKNWRGKAVSIHQEIQVAYTHILEMENILSQFIKENGIK